MAVLRGGANSHKVVQKLREQIREANETFYSRLRAMVEKRGMKWNKENERVRQQKKYVSERAREAVIHTRKVRR